MTPFKEGELTGGDFMANMGGLEHYKRFGYKGDNVKSDSCCSSLF